MKSIPEGFKPVQRPTRQPFNELVGPFYERRDEAGVSLGIRIEERHLNSRGICHGGFLSTMADLALGYGMLHALKSGGGFVTAQLSLDFAGAACEGDWLESKVDVQKVGGKLAFANCYLMVGEARIVRASAIFALPAKAAK
ncbi:MAG: PaaI family thioesterase [Betaproteobacteria bacterium]